MRVRVNGQDRELAAGATVADLVAGFELQPKHVAVEINRDLVVRAHYGSTMIAEGDRIEIVTLVGGG